MTSQSEAVKATPSTATTNSSSASGLVTVSNVAEIFNAAGFAFKKLGELVQHLDMGATDTAPAQMNGGPGPAATNGLSHWEQTDVEQFQTIVNNFNDELTKLSNNLKNKMSARLQAEHTEKTTNRTDLKLE